MKLVDLSAGAGGAGQTFYENEWDWSNFAGTGAICQHFYRSWWG